MNSKYLTIPALVHEHKHREEKKRKERKKGTRKHIKTNTNKLKQEHKHKHEHKQKNNTKHFLECRCRHNTRKNVPNAGGTSTRSHTHIYTQTSARTNKGDEIHQKNIRQTSHVILPSTLCPAGATQKLLGIQMQLSRTCHMQQMIVH